MSRFFPASTRPGLAWVFALLLALFAGSDVRSAAADGISFHFLAGIANGTSGIAIAYLGSTAAPADKQGDQIIFAVQPAPGSAAVPRFANGLAAVTVSLGGAPCDASRDDVVNPALVTKCFARAVVYSSTPGDVVYTAENTTGDGTVWTETVTFYPPRATAGNLLRGADPTELAIQNTGSGPATMVVEFFSAAGEQQLAAKVMYRSVPPGGMEGGRIPVNLPVDFTGTVVVGSDQSVALSVLGRKRTGAQFAHTIHNGAPFNGETTEQVISLPYVSNALESTYSTEVTLVNAGKTVACARLSYSFVPGAGAIGPAGRAPVLDAGPGGSGCASGYPIPVSGQVRFGPNAAPGVLAFPNSTRNALMAATVTVTGGAVLASVEAYTTDTNAKAASYEGFLVSGNGSQGGLPDTGTNLALPLGLKTADGYYTQYLFSNPGTTPANVALTYRGNSGPHTVQLSIAAGGVANHSVYSDATVPIGFVGAATVTSTVPIAGVIFRAKKVNVTSELDESLYTAVNAVPVARADRKWAFPVVWRRVGKDSLHDGRNSWISVSVPGGGTATVSLKTVGGCSEADEFKEYVSTRSVTDSFVFYLNADSDNGLGSNPACFLGGGILTSDVPVVAIASYINDLLPGDGEGVYNALR